MPLIQYNDAIKIVKQLYPSASEPMLTVELEASRGNSYRPYLVAAKFMITAYRNIEKADEVTFRYSQDAALNLLRLQKINDANDNNIPEGQEVEILEASICNSCDGGFGINVFG